MFSCLAEDEGARFPLCDTFWELVTLVEIWWWRCSFVYSMPSKSLLKLNNLVIWTFWLPLCMFHDASDSRFKHSKYAGAYTSENNYFHCRFPFYQWRVWRWYLLFFHTYYWSNFFKSLVLFDIRFISSVCMLVFRFIGFHLCCHKPSNFWFIFLVFSNCVLCYGNHNLCDFSTFQQTLAIHEITWGKLWTPKIDRIVKVSRWILMKFLRLFVRKSRIKFVRQTLFKL
jgi:hypothetical protein